MPMNVSLTKELEQFVSKKVKSGRYGSASEVIREGLRLLEHEDEKKRFSFSSRGDLESKLIEGVEALERGETVSARDVESELRLTSAKRRQKKNA